MWKSRAAREGVSRPKDLPSPKVQICFMCSFLHMLLSAGNGWNTTLLPLHPEKAFARWLLPHISQSNKSFFVPSL